MLLHLDIDAVDEFVRVMKEQFEDTQQVGRILMRVVGDFEGLIGVLLFNTGDGLD